MLVEVFSCRRRSSVLEAIEKEINMSYVVAEVSEMKMLSVSFSVG